MAKVTVTALPFKYEEEESSPSENYLEFNLPAQYKDQDRTFEVTSGTIQFQTDAGIADVIDSDSADYSSSGPDKMVLPIFEGIPLHFKAGATGAIMYIT